MLKFSRVLLSLSVLSFCAAASMSSAYAAHGTWAENHPHRVQVNSRLEHQNRRIDAKYRNGEITRAQALRLHAQTHRIRHEERLMASRHGGHLTRHDQYLLNRHENALSHRISRM